MARRWLPINAAAKKGQQVELGWLVEGRIEHKVVSHWIGDHWKGWWTPTHWRPI